MANFKPIRDLAKKKNITLRELANNINVSDDTIQKIIKNGRTNTETLEKISKELDVPVGVFFEDKKGITGEISENVDIEDIKQEKYASYFKTGDIGDGSTVNPNDFKLLIDLVNQKSALIEQKEQYIIKLHKQLEDKFIEFAAKLNENDAHCKTILAEKDRFIEKIITDRDALIKNMMDREQEIVTNSYERNKDNMERMDKMHEKMFELHEALMKIVENQNNKNIMNTRNNT
ncbi:hypothetical protein FACS1894180_3180 [Bacteroidia bacterium]|nr:hypothetical protein FACS1894180_3180 [Bacteroidia bacterium]